MFTIFLLYWGRLLLCFWYSPFQNYQISCISLYLRLSSQKTMPHSSECVEVCCLFFFPSFFESIGLILLVSFPFLCCLMITSTCIAFHLSVLYSFSFIGIKCPPISYSFLHLLKQRFVTITKNLDSLCPTVLFWVTKILQERWYFCYLPTCFSLDHPLLTFSRARDLEQGLTFLLFLSFRQALLLWSTAPLPFFYVVIPLNMCIYSFPYIFFCVALFLIISF